jgi:hypothetical protein
MRETGEESGVVCTHMELGRCEVGDVVVDGDLDDALHGHDGRGAHVVRRRRDGARVPVPLRVLTRGRGGREPSQEPVTRPGLRERWDGRKEGRRGTHREVGRHAERVERAALLREGHARVPESGSALKARPGASSAVAQAFSSHLRAAADIHAGGSTTPMLPNVVSRMTTLAT